MPKTLLESPSERDMIWLPNKRIREQVDPDNEASNEDDVVFFS
jgi:hypothetical protein